VSTQATLPGSAAQATEASIRRLVLVIVPLWLVALVANVASRTSQATPLLVGICLAAVVVAYAGYAWRDSARMLLAGTTVTTALAIAIGDPVASLSVFPLVVPWLNMATTVVGAVVVGRPGLYAVAGVSALGSLAVAQSSSASTAEIGGILAQALTGGLCMWVGVNEFRRAAAHTDDSTAQLLASQTASASEAARIAEHRAVSRALHDTVINTLGVLRLPDYDDDALRERAREDLALLGDSARPVDMTGVVTGWTQRAAVLGLDLTTDLNGPPEVPSRIREALSWAVMEAMLNTSKHSGQDCVSVRGQWTQKAGEVEVRDAGSGFAGARLSGGGGSSIVKRCAEAGIEVDCFDDNGAVVRFRWQPDDPPAHLPTADEQARPVLGRAALRIALVLAAAGAYFTGFSPALAGRVGGVATLVILAAVISWAGLAGRGRITTQPPLLLEALIVASVTVLPGMDNPGCERIAWHWWGSLAGLAVLVCVVLVDGRRSAIATGLSIYTVTFTSILITTPGLSGPCAGEGWSILLLIVGIVIGVAALRRVLIAQSDAVARNRRASAALAVGDAQLRARERVHEGLLNAVSGLYLPILRGIADGDLDPRDPDVRRSAADAETALRAVHSLPPELAGLSEGLAELIIGHAHRIRVVVMVPADAASPDDSLAEFLGFVDDWFNALPDGSQVHVLVIAQSDGCSALLTGPTIQGRVPPPGWQHTIVDDQSVFEIRWQTASLDPDADRLRPGSRNR
jgi:signal transduction histidine kinase